MAAAPSVQIGSGPTQTKTTTESGALKALWSVLGPHGAYKECVRELDGLFSTDMLRVANHKPRHRRVIVISKEHTIIRIEEHGARGTLLRLSFRRPHHTPTHILSLPLYLSPLAHQHTYPPAHASCRPRPDGGHPAPADGPPAGG